MTAQKPTNILNENSEAERTSKLKKDLSEGIENDNKTIKIVMLTMSGISLFGYRNVTATE